MDCKLTWYEGIDAGHQFLVVGEAVLPLGKDGLDAVDGVNLGFPSTYSTTAWPGGLVTESSAPVASLHAAKRDERHLAAKVMELLEDPESCRRMGGHGRQRVASELEWKYEASKLVAACGLANSDFPRPVLDGGPPFSACLFPHPYDITAHLATFCVLTALLRETTGERSP